MNLKNVNNNETELMSSSLHKLKKQSMSSQEKHKTVKRLAIESDNLNNDEENFCKTQKKT